MTGIKVFAALGSKCTRCRKVLPEVGLCPEHPECCMRCVEVVTGEAPDVFVLAAARFDRFLKEAREAGLPLAAAVIRAGNLNAGRPA